ncbi:MAG: prepilin peptidase [Candidatus Peribacteraceae bacterium]|nr:prepilin peptidase [Candidatus Peribacteraceae bacterium]
MQSDIAIVLFVILGLVFGSFGNVLIARLPTGEKITGRSHCPLCGVHLRIIDLIPVVSYLILQGHCRSCRKRISIRYPLVEAAGALLFILAYFLVPTKIPLAILLAAILWLLFIIAVIDASTKEIPDILTIPLIAICALFAFLQKDFSIVAPALGAALFALQWGISSGKWIGSGDILVAIGIGFLLATPGHVILWLLLSYIVGGVVAATLLLLKKTHRQAHIAFAPFLVTGALITLIVGDRLLVILP